MMNRRRFLSGAAAVLLGATACSRIWNKSSAPNGTTEGPTGGPEQSGAPDGSGPRPLRIALLSDPHTVAAGNNLVGAINGRLARAVAEYQPLRPDLWIVNGDITNDGLLDQYQAFKAIMAKVAKPGQLLVTTGNHDFWDKSATDQEEVRRFCEAFGQQTPYSSMAVGDLHIVMLADERYKLAPRYPEWAWLTPEQLTWFDQVLAAHRDKFTLVCLHQPLQETVTWSHGGNDFAGCGQNDQLREIVKRNPQVKLWFSGHTHMGAGIKGNVSRRDGIAFVGLGSTFYNFVESSRAEDKSGWPDYGGYKKDLDTSESRMVEVWPDRVVIRARNHMSGSWLDQHELVLKRT